MPQAGFKAVILERSASLRQSGAAIALQTNAFRALDLLGQGIAEGLRASHPELSVWEYYTEAGQLLKTLHLEQCSHGPHEMRGVCTPHSASSLKVFFGRAAFPFLVESRVRALREHSQRVHNKTVERRCAGTGWLARFPGRFPRALSAWAQACRA